MNSSLESPRERKPRFERWIDAVKDHPLLAVPLFVGSVVIILATFVNSLDLLRSHVRPDKREVSPPEEPRRPSLDVAPRKSSEAAVGRVHHQPPSSSGSNQSRGISGSGDQRVASPGAAPDEHGQTADVQSADWATTPSSDAEE